MKGNQQFRCEVGGGGGGGGWSREEGQIGVGKKVQRMVSGIWPSTGSRAGKTDGGITAPNLHVQVWEDGVSMTREKDVRDTPTGASRGSVWSHMKIDPKGRDQMLNYSSGKTLGSIMLGTTQK